MVADVGPQFNSSLVRSKYQQKHRKVWKSTVKEWAGCTITLPRPIFHQQLSRLVFGPPFVVSTPLPVLLNYISSDILIISALFMPICN